MEGDPHSVLEGMVIGGWAIGAHEGIIYVRDEYPLAVVNLTLAIQQARDAGLLGRTSWGRGSPSTSASPGGAAPSCVGSRRR